MPSLRPISRQYRVKLSIVSKSFDVTGSGPTCVHQRCCSQSTSRPQFCPAGPRGGSPTPSTALPPIPRRGAGAKNAEVARGAGIRSIARGRRAINGILAPKRAASGIPAPHAARRATNGILAPHAERRAMGGIPAPGYSLDGIPAPACGRPHATRAIPAPRDAADPPRAPRGICHGTLTPGRRRLRVFSKSFERRETS